VESRQFAGETSRCRQGGSNWHLAVDGQLADRYQAAMKVVELQGLVAWAHQAAGSYRFRDDQLGCIL
jgi:hypothetical protein